MSADWPRLHAMPANQARDTAAQMAYTAMVNGKSIGAGVPSRALSVAWSPDALGTLSMQAVAEAIAKGVCILVLSGVPGCGKTVAAAWWLATYFRDPAHRGRRKAKLDWQAGPDVVSYSYEYEGGTGLWVTAAQMARTDRYRSGGINALTSADRLVIDDLGAEFSDAKGFLGALVDEVINARYANELPTIITTNLDAPTFKERYGGRVVDRIREAGRFVGCGTESLRGKAAQGSSPRTEEDRNA